VYDQTHDQTQSSLVLCLFTDNSIVHLSLLLLLFHAQFEDLFPPYGGIFFHSSLIRCERTNTGPTEDPAFCKQVSRADKGAQNTKEKSRQFLTRN